MRILVAHPAPSFSVADVYIGWCEALEQLGQRVQRFNLDDRLTLYDAAYVDTSQTNPDGTRLFRKALSADQAISLASRWLLASCYAFWPDIVLVVSGFLIPYDILDIIRARRSKVVVVHTEEPYEHQRELELAAHADLNLVNDPTNLDAYRALGVPAAYLPHAYRPSVHHPGPADPKLACDLAFVGTGFSSRVAFLEAMDLDGLDVLLGGNWQRLGADSPLRSHLAHDTDECLDNTQTAEVYRAARVGLNLYRREADSEQAAKGWAMGPREVEMAACGLFFLRDPRGEGNELLPLPTFEGPEHASELLRWYLAHPGQRQVMAERAREAIADRTFLNNARRLLELLDRQPAVI